jgi:hypothetical protein
MEPCRRAIDLVVENCVKERLNAYGESNGRVVECDCPVNLRKKKNIVRIFSG